MSVFTFLSDALTQSGCIFNWWQPEIGDPEWTGWVTVLSYIVAAVLAFRVLRRNPPGASRLLWSLILALMAFLAVNKQLDLQSALTAWGRCLADTEGWYNQRQGVQLRFILGIIMATLAGIALLFALVRHKVRANLLALLGLPVLCAFILIRAAGFHHVDWLIGIHITSVTVNFLFENFGLVLIDINALLLLRGGPRSSSDDHAVRLSRHS